jgi:hypothetical protein
MPLAAAVDATTTELAREIAVMKKLNHPNVVKLFEVRVQLQMLLRMRRMPCDTGC